MMVTGITGSGKTQFVKKLLERRKKTIDTPIHHIYYHYGAYQKAFFDMSRTIPDITFVKGIPKEWEKLNAEKGAEKKNYIIVIDDLMIQALKQESTSLLYTVGSHHNNISVITLTQNLFPRMKEARTVSLNSHYLVLFKNPRDKSQIKTLASQLTDGKEERRHFLDAYVDATSKPYSYLAIDCKPEAPEELKFRSHIENDFQIAYLPPDYNIFCLTPVY